MTAIDDLFAQANTFVNGINWDKLESEGRGVPLDPDVAPHLGYWVDYLAPAFNRASDVINTLYYDPVIVNHVRTSDALNAVWKVFKDLAPEAQAYMRLQNPWLLFSPVALPAEDYRLMISYMWGVIMYGVQLHTSFAIVAVGREQWRKSADTLVRMCEAISVMDKAGALSRLKWGADDMVALRAQQGVSDLKPFSQYVSTSEPKPPATSGAPDGLGLPPLVIGAIVVGAVIGIVMIYGLYEWAKTATEINKQTLDATAALCANPTYANDPATKQQCLSVLGTALAESTKPKLPGSEILTYLYIAGGIIGFAVLAPHIFALIGASKKMAASTA